MTRKLRLCLGAVLVVLPLMASTTYADELPISMKWVGSVADAAIDTNGDGLFADTIDANAKGSFGPSTMTVFSEFFFMGFCDAEQKVLYLGILYSKPVMTFANGDQLWGSISSGWMCMNTETGEFNGEGGGEEEEHVGSGSGSRREADGPPHDPEGRGKIRTRVPEDRPQDPWREVRGSPAPVSHRQLIENIMLNGEVIRLDGGIRKAEEPAPASGVLLVFYSEDLERDVARVRELGGTISQDIFSFPGGRRFHFVDPVGTEFAIWSEGKE